LFLFVRYLLDKIRTFFDENLDCGFLSRPAFASASCLRRGFGRQALRREGAKEKNKKNFLSIIFILHPAFLN
jgi:hypothetical protein